MCVLLIVDVIISKNAIIGVDADPITIAKVTSCTITSMRGSKRARTLKPSLSPQLKKQMLRPRMILQQSRKASVWASL